MRPALVLALTLLVILGVQASASSVIRHGPRDQPWVALTFDDGWSIDRCARIVRTLRAKRVPATFFVNGAILQRDPDRWRKLLRGFSVANHTLSHKDLTRLDAAGIRSQVELNEKLIERVLERPMLRLLRPSYGAYDDEVLRIASALGYHTILWDTDSGDGRSGATTRSIIANGSRGGRGAVVLLHCGPAATPPAISRIIERYRARGYRLVDLERMLDFEPPATACRVTNERSGDVSTSLQRAARRAVGGDRLTLEGTCLGTAQVRKDLEVVGLEDEDTGPPTLDGVGKGTVLTVKAGTTVTVRGLTVAAGERGIENHGNLTLDGVIVQGNRGEQAGAGVYNARGANLVLGGSSAVRRNTARLAGGGILNAGTLELRDGSSVVRNGVIDDGHEAADATGDTDPLDGSHPLLDGSPVAGAGGGIMDLGIMLGAVCAPEPDANIRGNTPDDCYSLDSSIPVPWALDALPVGVVPEWPGQDEELPVPTGCPWSEDGCPTDPSEMPDASS